VTRTPLSRSKGQRSRSPGRFTHRGVNASGSCSGERGNVFCVGIYCYVAVCTAGAVGSAARGASAPTEGGEGRVHIVAAARLQLVIDTLRIILLSVTSLQLTVLLNISISRNERTVNGLVHCISETFCRFVVLELTEYILRTHSAEGATLLYYARYAERCLAKTNRMRQATYK